ncbi:hypothetical protein [Rhizobium sp. Rhizsp82]|uniref:hypothetical protein n=1 Tax=Rhizobium sp. Rhizsp82 TaxID=3243057 RepID=UPI0039B54971
MGVLQVFRRLYKQAPHETAEHFKEGFENAARFREVVFSTVEGVVILAALEKVAEKTGSLALWVIYCAAWIALFWYLLFFGRYVINATNEKFEILRNHTVFSYVAAISATFLSWGLVSVLTNITRQFLDLSFMQ